MKTANSSLSLLPTQELQDMIESYEVFPYEEDDATIDRIFGQIVDSLIEPDEIISKKWMSYVNFLAEAFDSIEEKIKIVVNESSFGDTGSSKYNGYFHTKAADQVK